MNKLLSCLCGFLEYCEKRGLFSLTAAMSTVVLSVLFAIFGVIAGLAQIFDYVGIDQNHGLMAIVIGMFSLPVIFTIRALIVWRKLGGRTDGR